MYAIVRIFLFNTYFIRFSLNFLHQRNVFFCQPDQNVASQIEETDKNGSTDVLRSKLTEILGRPSLEHIVDVNCETTPQVVKTKSKLNQENNDPLPKLTKTSALVATTRRGPVTRAMSLKRSKTGADNSETTPQVVETKSKLNQENNDPLPKPTETSASVATTRKDLTKC